MSGRSRCSGPRNALVATLNSRTSYAGSRSAKPGVPGSGGRPWPGLKQTSSAGNRCAWWQVHPAAVSWAGVTPSAEAGPAVASVAPPASAAATAAAAIRDLTLIRGLFMITLVPSGRLLDAHDHGVGPGERFGVAVAEAGVGQPRAAVGGGVVEAGLGFDEHVHAHEQAEGVGPAVVVDDGVVDDEGGAVRQRVVGLGQEGELVLQAAVVQDAGRGQRVRGGTGD